VSGGDKSRKALLPKTEPIKTEQPPMQQIKPKMPLYQSNGALAAGTLKPGQGLQGILQGTMSSHDVARVEWALADARTGADPGKSIGEVRPGIPLEKFMKEKLGRDIPKGGPKLMKYVGLKTVTLKSGEIVQWHWGQFGRFRSGFELKSLTTGEKLTGLLAAVPIAFMLADLIWGRDAKAGPPPKDSAEQGPPEMSHTEYGWKMFLEDPCPGCIMP
jgi:hypothetical protein